MKKKEFFLYYWWECKLVQLICTIKRQLPCDLASPLLGIYSEKNYNSKRCMNPNVIKASLITTSKTWKQSKCPLTDEGIKKM